MIMEYQFSIVLYVLYILYYIQIAYIILDMFLLHISLN